MSFYNVLEGKIGRLSLNEENIALPTGFFTDNITSCCIIILLSQDKKKYVMIHADSSFQSTNQLKEQLDWVGENAQAFVFLRVEGYLSPQGHNQSSLNLLATLWPNYKLENNLKVNFIPNDHEVVFIALGDTPTTAPKLHAKTEYHPQAPLLFAHHQLSGLFKERLQGLFSRANRDYLNPLLYDNQWQVYDSVTLSPQIIQRMKRLGLVDPDADCCRIYDILKRQFRAGNFCSDENFFIVGCGTVLLYYYLLENPNQTLEFQSFLKYQAEKFKNQYQDQFGETNKGIVNNITAVLSLSKNKTELNAAMFKVGDFLKRKVNAVTHEQIGDAVAKFCSVILSLAPCLKGFEMPLAEERASVPSMAYSSI